jgi:hypothetical protein
MHCQHEGPARKEIRDSQQFMQLSHATAGQDHGIQAAPQPTAAPSVSFHSKDADSDETGEEEEDEDRLKSVQHRAIQFPILGQEYEPLIPGAAGWQFVPDEMHAMER